MNIASLSKNEESRNGFYPTPLPVAEKLLQGIDWDMILDVLEPSAGKGNLISAIAQKLGYRRRYSGQKVNVDCVEIDPHLRSILQYEYCGSRSEELYQERNTLNEKQRYNPELGAEGELTQEEQARLKKLNSELDNLHAIAVHIIHDDFLTLDTRKHYDLIVMNPPFSDGDTHLLKAIQIQENGGKIRCILNAETLRNPYTNRRKVLQTKLTELGAEVEYPKGAFTDAERKTDVDIAIIRINIPCKKRESTIFERLRKAAAVEQQVADVTEMTVSDFIGQIVSRFKVEADAGIELIREYEAMKPYILDSFEEERYGIYPTLTLCVGEPGRFIRGSVPSINQYLQLVRAKYWAALFSNKEFVGKLTSNLRNEYTHKVSAMSAYDFTIFNIQQISEQMNAEMGRGIEETIIALFDKLTQEHAWYPECAKNIHYYSGWKTNKAHKVNSKVILPIHGIFSDYSWSKETFQVREAESTIADIEKVFDYLDGDMTASVDLCGVLQRACEEGQTRNIHCKYFDVTLYKKGTMHIKFRTQDIVDRFNIYCCRKKRWLPPSYGEKAYCQMTCEEKTVIDGFHGNGTENSGEKAYNVVMSRAAYYLAEPHTKLLALTAPAI